MAHAARHLRKPLLISLLARAGSQTDGSQAGCLQLHLLLDDSTLFCIFPGTMTLLEWGTDADVLLDGAWGFGSPLVHKCALLAALPCTMAATVWLSVTEGALLGCLPLWLRRAAPCVVHPRLPAGASATPSTAWQPGSGMHTAACQGTHDTARSSCQVR